MTDDLVEKVIDAMSNCGSETVGSRMARAAIAVVLEEAASYCEMKAKHCWGDGRDCCDAALQQTAAAIRALVKQSTTEEERA